jgi:peptidoglycan/LPS O-acetylase OafA/YrhL
LTAVTYTSNYYRGGSWLLGHLWSLSVEKQFYLLWPLKRCGCFFGGAYGLSPAS